jgi:hypothetical protein
VVHADETISTSLGYQGHGVLTESYTGRIDAFTNRGITVNESGDRVGVHVRFVADFGTGTVRIKKFSLTCLNS